IPDDLSKAVGKFKPEDKIIVTLKRDKKEQKLTAVLAKPATTSVYSRNFNFDYNNDNFTGRTPYNLMLTSGQPRLGIKAQDTDDSKGVKVLEVDKNSAAEKSGLLEGDLITEFDGRAVNGATELMEAVRSAKDKNNMKVKLMRGSMVKDIEIKIPKKLKTANL
ncbi:MAG: PDZ domain-containing protein, partial [Chitinophagaceae bacterium]